MRDFRHCIFLWIFSIFLLNSCTPLRNNRPSIVIFLVESFGENDFVCSDMRALEDLDELKAQCGNFTRFTHAYAPSTLSQAVLASIMTGSDIRKHQVYHNGRGAIPAAMKTLAEKALTNGMKTGFFSGGAPIFNKFGIHQGFEVFDHSYTTEPKSHFRPVLSTMKAGLKWVDNKVGEQPVFMTMYFPDLLHSRKKTTTDEGDERARDRQAQLQEIYESLNEFIVEFKSRKRWKNTFFILAGVNGPTSFQEKSINTLDDITSQKTHIALQIKPNRGLKEHFKKVHNSLLRLTDIGPLLEDFVFSKVKPQPFEDWFSRRNQRAIGVRSDWGVWRMAEGIPVEGLRMDQYLFTFSPSLRVYDSFNDGKEVDPLPINEALAVARQYKLDHHIKKLKMNPCILKTYQTEVNDLPRNPPCGQMLPQSVKKATSLSDFLKWRWLNIQSNEDFSGVLWKSMESSKGDKSTISIGWLSDYYLRQKKWEKLLKLSKQENNKFWEIVAKKNLNTKINEVFKGCHFYFIDNQKSLKDFYRYCEDSSLRKVAEGLGHLKGEVKALKSFWYEISDIRKKRYVKKLNLEMMLKNDVKEALNFEPSLSELYFYLPENREFKKLIEVDET